VQVCGHKLCYVMLDDVSSLLQTEMVQYSEMVVSSESDQYSVYFTWESSHLMEDTLERFSFNKFSTFDSDNDQSPEFNCAAKCGAGFWYEQCEPGGEVSNINQSPGSTCAAAFAWDMPSTILSETKLYLMC